MPDRPRHAAQLVLAPGASARRVQDALAALGFMVGPCVGNSFSIEAPADDFHTVFGVRLAQRSDGGVTVDGQPPAERGLPLQRLPASLRPLVTAVVFSEPPAFGPGAP
ncbi:MAG: hypothetical protein Q8K45_20785 [Rubrivivax sp.]|nr:hypothetical protein [Rubrivivax sp.]